MKRVGLVASLYLMAICGGNCGGLKWQQDSISKTVGLLEKEVSVEFHAKNEGANPIKIERVDTSCGCVAARVLKSVVEPGESTSIAIDVKTTKLTGESRKSIVVKTDEPGLMVYQLRIDISKELPYVPEVSEMEWKEPHSLESRRLIIRRAEDLPLGVEVSRSISEFPDAISVEVERSESMSGTARELVVNITPLRHGISHMKPIGLILKDGDKVINSPVNVSIDVE